MMFSVGILYSVQEFLKFVKETPLNTADFKTVFPRFSATSPSLILEVAENSNWINIDMDSHVSVTSKGDTILTEPTMRDSLRMQLKHLIGDVKPSWSYLIHKGRKEAYQYFPADVQQCFKEAGLIDSYDEEVIKWWDILASMARGRQQDTQLEVGRLGERLSKEFETKRTGEEAVWKSIDSNLAGYDILSVISTNNDAPLRIEVKASTINSNMFTFFLSRNEWYVASNSPNYLFHLWKLDGEPELYIVDKSDVAKSIPLNQGDGSWENVKIEVDIGLLEMKNKKGGRTPL